MSSIAPNTRDIIFANEDGRRLRPIHRPVIYVSLFPIHTFDMKKTRINYRIKKISNVLKILPK